MITPDEARERILADAEPLEKVRVPLLESLRRVLAEDVVSDIDVAPFDNSAMDGYAVRAADTTTATPEAPVVLRVVDHIPADRMPEATVGTGGTVGIQREVRSAENVRYRGEDVREGDVVLRTGEVIDSAAIGLMAAMGYAEVFVGGRPRVAIVSTGDELVEVAFKPGPGRIRNSNAWSLAAQVLEAGGEPHVLG